MRLKKLLAVVIGLIVLISPMAVLGFDRDAGVLYGFEAWAQAGDYQEFEASLPYKDVSTSFTKCTVLGTAEGFYADFDKDGNLISRRGTGVYGQEGSVFYVGNGYWITNTHVIEPESVVIELTKNVSVVTYPIKILSKIITIGQATGLGSVPAELIYVDEERDICLLKVVGNWPAFIDPGYRPEWTRTSAGDRLFSGMSVAVLVSIRNAEGDKTPWFEVRYGKIVSTGVKLPGDLPNELLPWFSLNDVTTDLVIYPGDSGSPVFAWIDGKPVIIGAARAAAGYQDFYSGDIYYYSYFTRVDIVIPFVIEK
jgi:S1-C subfamily serine protease